VFFPKICARDLGKATVNQPFLTNCKIKNLGVKLQVNEDSTAMLVSDFLEKNQFFVWHDSFTI
jgi:hypothetical protein